MRPRRFYPTLVVCSGVLWLSLTPMSSWAERPDVLWMRGGHYISVTAVAYAPDGATVASGGYDGTIKLWRVADGMLLRTLTGHQAPPSFYGKPAAIRSLAFSPDGATLASAGNESTVKVWRVADASVIQTLSAAFAGTPGCLNGCGVAFSPNGQMLGVATTGVTFAGGLRIWRVADWAPLFDSTQYGPFAFSPDPATPDRVATAYDNGLRIIRIPDGTVILEIPSPSVPLAPAFSPDGQLILTSNGRVFSTTDGALVASLNKSGLVFGGFGFSPDGQTLALSGLDPNNDGTGQLHSVINVFRRSDLSNPAPAPALSWSPHGGGQAVITFSPDSQALVSGGGGYALQSNFDSSVKMWSVADGSPIGTLTAYSGAARQVAMSPDGQTVAAAIEAPFALTDPLGMNALRLWDASTGAPKLTIPDLGQSSVAFSPDGLSLAAAGRCCSWSIAARGVADGSLLPVPSGNPVPGLPPVAFSPDSQTVASYASDGSVQLWSLADGTLAFLAQSPSQGSKILVASRDATRLAAVAGDGKQVQVWDTAGHALLTTLQYGQFVTALAFSPDGQTLAAGLTPSLSSETGTSIVILRIADGTAVGSPFVGHTGYVVALAYSPDGAGLASGSSDSTLRFWRVADGAPLKTYDEETGRMPGREPSVGVRSVVFSPGGTSIAYSRADATIVVARNPLVPREFTLTVSRAGTGVGSITSNPPGIDCGSSCAAPFTETTVVTLTATPAADSYFAGWSGDAECSGGAVTMNADKGCTATFHRTDLVVSALSAPDVAGAGLPVTVTATTMNQGPGPASASTTRFYLSTDGSVGGGAVLLGGHAVPALAASTGDTGSITLTIPDGTAAGTYFLVASADAEGLIPETNETNNNRSHSIAIGPDLTIPALTVPALAGAGSTITVSDTTQNNGSAVGVSTTTAFYLSPTPALGEGAVRLGSRAVAPLAAGTADSGSALVTIPTGTATGSYFIVARADDLAAVAETSEENNAAAQAILIGPDLVVSALTVPALSGAGVRITVSDTTKNQGGPAGATTTRFYLSTTPTLGPGAVQLGRRNIPALAAGASSSGSTSVTIPLGTATGSYFIVARADDGGVVTEAVETNNTLSRPIMIGPDLVISALSAPATAAAGTKISINDTTSNQGGGAALASTTRFYLSATQTLGPAAVSLGARSVAIVGAGASRSGSTQVTIPTGTASGSYFIIAVADADGLVAETNETNNASSRALTVP